MRLVDQEVEIWGECPYAKGSAYAWIERAARICYNTEPTLKTSPIQFIKSKLLAHEIPHSAMLEHSNIVVRPPREMFNQIYNILNWGVNRWLSLTVDSERNIIIYGNLRAWMEKLEVKDPEEVYDCIDNKYGWERLTNDQLPHEMRRVTAKLITDRAVLAEITRHRNDVGFAVQSQRYVDYKKGIDYIKPSWFESADSHVQNLFINSCERNEWDYTQLREAELSPQHARTVLSNQAKTVIVMTAYLPQWEWMLKLRTGSGAYPQMRNLMSAAESQMQGLSLLQ